jgi:hypothetical protein
MEGRFLAWEDVRGGGFLLAEVNTRTLTCGTLIGCVATLHSRTRTILVVRAPTGLCSDGQLTAERVGHSHHCSLRRPDHLYLRIGPAVLGPRKFPPASGLKYEHDSLFLCRAKAISSTLFMRQPRKSGRVGNQKERRGWVSVSGVAMLPY